MSSDPAPYEEESDLDTELDSSEEEEEENNMPEPDAPRRDVSPLTEAERRDLSSVPQPPYN